MKSHFLTKFKERHPFVYYWLPVFLWMTAIFYLSSRPASAIEVVQLKLSPLLCSQYSIHIFEFGVLGLLLIRALKKCPKLKLEIEEFGSRKETKRGLSVFNAAQEKSRNNFRTCLLAFALVMSYALFDELHQLLFVFSRNFEVIDLVMDGIGGIIGILAYWFVNQLINRRFLT